MSAIIDEPIKAPFPAFGGKSEIADLVWDRLGDPDNYVEPFCFSAAMLLRRPPGKERRIETINDLNCMVANFWRATQHAPEAVAEYADWPVNEVDLHARHFHLVFSDEAKRFREQVREDPAFYDCKFAGWWCWGACCWIGSGWCPEILTQQLPHMGPGQGVTKLTQQLPHMDATRGIAGLPEKRPQLRTGNSAYGPGVHAKPVLDHTRPKIDGNGIHGKPTLTHKRPVVSADGSAFGKGVNGRPQLADQYSRGRGVNGNDIAEACSDRRIWLTEWFCRLRDRLRTVRVCCGDWERVCGSPSTTTRIGLTGVFLDPPYRKRKADGTENRSGDLYVNDKNQDVEALVDRVQLFCLKHGPDPQMRIAVCGYEGEGYERLETEGWAVEHWKANGGYGNRTEKGQQNRSRERVWFSPHCERGAQGVLFSAREEVPGAK